jgi:hypothetical protein
MYLNELQQMLEENEKYFMMAQQALNKKNNRLSAELLLHLTRSGRILSDEYSLIQEKKSTLSKAQRDFVCEVYEELMKQEETVRVE